MTVRAFLNVLRRDKLASGDKVERALAMHYEDLSAIHAVIDSTESGLDPFTKELMKSTTASGYFLWTKTDKILETRRDWIRFNVTDKNGNDHHKVQLPFQKTDLLDENGHVYLVSMPLGACLLHVFSVDKGEDCVPTSYGERLQHG